MDAAGRVIDAAREALASGPDNLLALAAVGLSGLTLLVQAAGWARRRRKPEPSPDDRLTVKVDGSKVEVKIGGGKDG